MITLLLCAVEELPAHLWKRSNEVVSQRIGMRKTAGCDAGKDAADAHVGRTHAADAMDSSRATILSGSTHQAPDPEACAGG